MGVKILIFSRGTLGQNSMFPEKGGQNSIFFPSALKKGGQNRGAYQPTSLKWCPPPGLLPIYISIVPLKFAVDIQSQIKVRVRKPKIPIWLPGGHFEINIAENQ